MKCEICGFENLDHAPRCMGCGTRFVDPESQPEPPEPLSPEDLEELELYTPTVFFKLRMGETIAKTFSIYFRHFVPFFLVTLIAYLPVLIINLTMMGVDFENDANADMLLLVFFGGMLLSLLAITLATAAMTYGVLQHLRERPLSVGECLRAGLSVILPVIGVAFLQGLATTVGMMLCIIPGIIIAVTLAAAVPAAVEERPGPIKALRRSAELTKGYRDQIFGILFVIGTINIVVAGMIALVTTVSPIAMHILDTIRDVLNTGLTATASALIYYQLRSLKESLDLNELASVFD